MDIIGTPLGIVRPRSRKRLRDNLQRRAAGSGAVRGPRREPCPGIARTRIPARPGQPTGGREDTGGGGEGEELGTQDLATQFEGNVLPPENFHRRMRFYEDEARRYGATLGCYPCNNPCQMQGNRNDECRDLIL